MKSLLLSVLALSLSVIPALSESQETLQEHLLSVQLQREELVASGYELNHPKVQGLDAEISVLEKDPGAEIGDYEQLVHLKLLFLEASRARVLKEGHSEGDPTVHAIDAQINFLKMKLAHPKFKM